MTEQPRTLEEVPDFHQASMTEALNQRQILFDQLPAHDFFRRSDQSQKLGPYLLEYLEAVTEILEPARTDIGKRTAETYEIVADLAEGSTRDLFLSTSPDNLRSSLTEIRGQHMQLKPKEAVALLSGLDDLALAHAEEANNPDGAYRRLRFASPLGSLALHAALDRYFLKSALLAPDSINAVSIIENYGTSAARHFLRGAIDPVIWQEAIGHTNPRESTNLINTYPSNDAIRSVMLKHIIDYVVAASLTAPNAKQALWNINSLNIGSYSIVEEKELVRSKWLERTQTEIGQTQQEIAIIQKEITDFNQQSLSQRLMQPINRRTLRRDLRRLQAAERSQKRTIAQLQQYSSIE